MTNHIFYKAVLESDLKHGYIPGTVTKDYDEAYTWWERIQSKKRHGPSRHIRHGKAVIIKIDYKDNLHPASEFQRSGVKEHDRLNCWTANDMTKAQINSPVQYQVLSI